MEKINRVEFKYLLDLETHDKVLQELKSYVELDKYNNDSIPYKINNIYYDNNNGYLAHSAMNNADYKFKIRYRTYGEQPKKGFLELKEKNNGIISKTRVTQLVDPNNATDEEIDTSVYINSIIQTYQLKPKSIITYDRLAYFEKGNSDLRITFDYNILGQTIDTEDKILLTDKVVMEIKTSNGLSQWILILLAKYKIHSVSFSKYIRHYKKSNK